MKEKIKKLLIKHPELIKEQYRDPTRPLFGHCYTATEAYYHATGKADGFASHCMKIPEGTHWYLKNPVTGEIIDLTCGKIKYDYSTGHRVPFQTKRPSKRAQIILDQL